MAQAGATPPLVDLLTSGTPVATENAAAVLCNLAVNADDQGRVSEVELPVSTESS